MIEATPAGAPLQRQGWGAIGCGATMGGEPMRPSWQRPLDRRAFLAGSAGVMGAAPDRMVIRLFRWDVNREPLEAIDLLEPFYTTEL